MSEKNRARIVLVCGGSGTGKSAWVKREIAKARRLLVWDVTGEYARAGLTPLSSCAELVAAIRAPAGRLAFVPHPTAKRGLSSLFDFWSRCAYAWAGATIVADELADVTTPAKAPEGWGMVIRRGRHRGLAVYAVTQRPAESDKTTVGNATLIHCCRLKRATDRAYMAREMGIDQSRLDALAPLDWLESDDRGRVKAGKLTF